MKRIVTYVAITFGLTWLVWGCMALSGLSLNESLAAQGITAVTMWLPAAGVWLTGRVYPGRIKLGATLRPAFRGNARTYLFAWLFPACFTLLGAALYFLLFPAQFDPALSAYAQSAPGGMEATPAAIALMIGFTALIAPLLNALFGLGEEIGWRGFLYPAMREAMSERKAAILCGVIWGLWHAPITAMGHNYGLAYRGYPWLGIAAMCLFCISLGILLSYITTKSASIWPAALAHGAVNAVAGTPLLFQAASYESYQVLGPSLPGVLAGLPLLLFALFVLMRHYRRRA